MDPFEPFPPPGTGPLRRETPLEWRHSDDLLRATLAESADTLVLLDTSLHIRFLNKPSGGLRPERCVGKAFEALLPAGARERIASALRRLVADGLPTSFEYAEAAESERPRYFEGRAVFVATHGGDSGLCVTIRDISERKLLERQILDVTDRERQRIGRDLHDGLGQELTGISLMMRALAAQLEPTQRRALDEIASLVSRSLDSARVLSSGLLPISDAHGGLIVALRRLADSSRRQLGVSVDFHADAWPPLAFTDVQASHVYRIAQEALTNVARHSGARAVAIVLNVDAKRFRLAIADDGCGIRRAPHGSGLGLRIMANRADIIGATLTIDANKPRGTVVSIHGPHVSSPGGV